MCYVCEDLIFYNDQEDKWIMRIENSNWDYYSDGFDYDDYEVNFCFECGKDYRTLKQCHNCNKQDDDISKCKGCREYTCPDCCVGVTQYNMVDFPFCKTCDEIVDTLNEKY